ncbi:MAG: BBE domain-containing protein [Methanomassiliicoccus sp.]|nr:BBE domain-containing protein [Methanomassiliicoccus sp.]
MNKPTVMINACYSGPMELGEQTIAPLKHLGRPLADMSRPLDYLEMQDLKGAMGSDGTSRTRNYWKSIYINELSSDIVDVLRTATEQRPSELSTISIYYLGGAYTRVRAEEAAFDNRDQRFLISMEATWTEPEDDDTNIRWARDAFDAVRRGAEARVYLNFAGFAEEEGTVERAFGSNIDRLRDIKARYDPENLFRGHLDVRPSIRTVTASRSK